MIHWFHSSKHRDSCSWRIIYVANAAAIENLVKSRDVSNFRRHDFTSVQLFQAVLWIISNISCWIPINKHLIWHHYVTEFIAHILLCSLTCVTLRFRHDFRHSAPFCHQVFGFPINQISTFTPTTEETTTHLCSR